MAITFFGVASVPTDNGTNTANPTAFSNPPIASMAAGDLVFVYAWCRTASATIAVSNSGGQNWNAVGTSQSSANATLTVRAFWCVFNGTWSAAPSFSFGATTNNSVVMVVFRPTTTSNLWGADGAQPGAYTDKAAAASFLQGGHQPINQSTVSIVVSATDDDNTWNLSGTNWIRTSLSNQYRNTSGNDTSSTIAYQILTSSTSLATCTQTQATLGNDGGFQFAICFYEFDPRHFIPRDLEQPYFGRTKIYKSGVSRVVALPHDSDALAFISAAGITNATQKWAVDVLVKGLKSAGIWAKCIAIYPFVGGSSNSHKFNLKDPRDLDAAYRLSFSGGTHDSNGWQPSTSFADTFINANSVLSLDNTHISYYSRTNVTENSYEVGCDDLTNFLLLGIRSGSGNARVNVFGNSEDNFPNSTVLGFFVPYRDSSSRQGYYRNGLSAGNSTSNTSVGKASLNIYLGASNQLGVAIRHSSRQCAFASIGESFTSTEQLTYYNLVQEFQTTLNRQV